MNPSWAFTAAVLMCGLLFQTCRVQDRAADVAVERDKVAALELQVRTFKRAVLSNVVAATEVDRHLAREGLYMIVDSRCGVCATAVARLEEHGSRHTVRIASFVDSPDDLEEWLVGLGASLEVVRAPLDSTFIFALPRHVTPLYLEFQDNRPIDIHIGTPLPEWLASSP